MAIRFLHTADWQFGMGYEGHGAAAARLREARFEAVDRALSVAVERSCDLVLVAGDVFETSAVDPALIDRTVDLLAGCGDRPVLVLPGNHDPLGEGSVWRSAIWRERQPANVTILERPEPLRLGDRGDIAGVEILPCPCLASHSREDPTAWIPPRGEEAGPIRVGVAHGTWRLVPDLGEEDHPIPADAARARDLDYLALGHWHSRWPEPGDPAAARTFYAGTPEPSRFGESRSGGALLVEIDGPGALPRVEVIETAVHEWRDVDGDLDAPGDVDALRAEVDAIPASAIVRVRLSGSLDPEGRSRLDAFETHARDRFRDFRLVRNGLILVEEDLDDWIEGAVGTVRAAAEELRERAEAGDGTARRSLRLLHRFAAEASS